MSDAGKVLKIIGAVAVFAAALWLSFQAGRLCRIPSPQTNAEPKTDTLYIRDTFVRYTPVYVTRRVVDSVIVPVTVRDTVVGRDTIYVKLERQQVEWRDSLCTVYASGIRPSVDSVAHYVAERIVTVPVEVRRRDHWGLGLQAGAGFGKGGVTPYVGVGVSWNLLSW
jgi:hypothetical protein